MTRTFFFLFILIASCSQLKKHEEPAIPGSLEEAVGSSARAEENSERDEYQHPKETLEYFGIKPNMTVVEISPGAGYYTEILAPYLAKEGQYVMAIPRIPQNPPPFLIENERKLQDILLRQSEVKAKTKFIPFEPVDERNRIKKDYVDLVLVFSHVHNWIAKEETEASLKFCYDILKMIKDLIIEEDIRDYSISTFTCRAVPYIRYLTPTDIEYFQNDLEAVIHPELFLEMNEYAEPELIDEKEAPEIYFHPALVPQASRRSEFR